MNFRELIDTILIDIDEDRSDAALVTKLKGFVNRAYMELAKREGIEKVKNVVPVEGFIKHPEDYVKLYEILYGMDPMPYSHAGDKIYCPTEKEVMLVYNYRPELLEEDTDELVTNPVNEEFILSYAKWLYYCSEQETNQAQLEKVNMSEFKITIMDRGNWIKPIYFIGGV